MDIAILKKIRTDIQAEPRVTPRPVLLIDDEPANVDALEQALATQGIPYETVYSLQDAVTMVVEGQEAGTPYGALVVDNHYSDESDIFETGEVQGVDFAGVMLGNPRNETQVSFVNECIPGGIDGLCYQGLTDEYQGKVVLFSGSATFQALQNPGLLDGIPVILKVADTEDGRICEDGVVQFLKDVGYKFKKDFDMAGYKKEQGLSDGMGNDQHALDETRRFLEQSGEFTPEQLEAFFACEA